jgi:predicted ribosome quality control (RQC) complex YloA/Tae2 family protein
VQPIDLTTLLAVLAELATALVPSRFEKAQQSDPHTLQLALRTLHGSLWLELSWLAEAPRLLAIPPPPRQGEGSTLAQQLQHSLRGLALVELWQQGWERVVELRFAPRPGEPLQRTLVLELMGRHSNLFLLDGERRVIALARQVRAAQSRIRPIGTGDAYQPPPALAAEPPRLQESQEAWQRRLRLLPLPLGKALLGAYQGTSPALVRQLLPDPAWGALPVAALDERQWQELWQHWQAWLHALDRRCFQLSWQGVQYRCWTGPQPPAGGVAGTDADATDAGMDAGTDAGAGAGTGDGTDPAENAGKNAVAEAAVAAGQAAGPLAINQQLAGFYTAGLAQRRWQHQRQQLQHRLQQAVERERAQLHQQQELLAAVPGGEALQHEADALLCHPHPDRDTIERAQALYRRARKLRRSVAAITPRLELHQQRLQGLETSLTFLEQLEDPADLQGLEEELLEQLARLRPGAGPGAEPGAGGQRRRRARQGRAEPRPLELRSRDGLRLQVGRNHRQNEWISLRQARRGDLWFHAQELPGSHVVLKGSEGAAGEADLQAAADLAAHFSRGRANGRVPVVMVPTDGLQRIPGAEPGTVRHRGGELLWGVPQRALALLAGSSLAPGASQGGDPPAATPP